MLNQVIIVGRLKEIIKVEKNKLNLVVSVPQSFKNKDGKYDVDLIDCEVGGSIADTTNEYCEIGNVIGEYIEDEGFSVVRNFMGHGICKLFHTLPNVPHYKKNKTFGIMKPGNIFTIEPMVNEGTWKDVKWLDGWTAVTEDGKRSAQFEHTLLVTEDGVEV